MKQLLFLPFLIPCYLMAQPVLNNDIFTQIGDVIQLQPVQPENVTEGTAGANQIWDYTNLSPIPSAAFQLKYLDAATTPYADSFALSNLATEYVDDDGVVSYAYFNQTGNQLWFLGAAFSEAIQVYDNPDLLAQTPMNFNDMHAHSYSGYFNYSGYAGNIYGTKTSKYDAYGTLKMPETTYPNAVRTYTHEVRTDSVGFEAGAYSIDITEEDYYAWFVPGIHSAVMEVRYSTMVTQTVIPGFPTQVTTLPTEKAVTYQLNPTSAVGEQPNPTTRFEMQLVAANPVADQRITLSFTSQERMPLTLSVLSAQGQLVQQTQTILDAGTTTQHLDMAGFPAGQYFIHAAGRSGEVVKKIVKM